MQIGGGCGGISFFSTHNPLPPKSFRMNTCKSISKQSTLTSFRMNTYEKHRGWGRVLWLTRFRPASTFRCANISTCKRSSHPEKPVSPLRSSPLSLRPEPANRPKCVSPRFPFDSQLSTLNSVLRYTQPMGILRRLSRLPRAIFARGMRRKQDHMTHIVAGNIAPGFSLKSLDDKEYSLATLLARGPVIAAFFKI